MLYTPLGYSWPVWGLRPINHAGRVLLNILISSALTLITLTTGLDALTLWPRSRDVLNKSNCDLYNFGVGHKKPL